MAILIFNSKDDNAVVEIILKLYLKYMNMTLLIVDDDLPFREAYRSMEKKGFNVVLPQVLKIPY